MTRIAPQQPERQDCPLLSQSMTEPVEANSSIILLAVVDGGNGREKLRLYRRSYPQGDLSALDLQTELGLDREDTTLEIFDPVTNEYSELDSVNGGIVQRFGSRIRIVVKPRATQTKTPPLAITGRFFDFDGSLQVAGHNISIHQDVNLPHAGTAGTVWDGAILLTRCCLADEDILSRRGGGVVLELGAGCGLAGIATAVWTLARSLVLTDLSPGLQRLQRNVQTNRASLQAVGCEHVMCRACDWYNPPDLQNLLEEENTGTTAATISSSSRPSPPTPLEADMIVVADCVWTEELVAPLFATLRKYVTTSRTQVLVCYQRRGKRTDEAFWKAVHGVFGSVDELRLPPTTPPVFHLLSCRI
jgi:predicted nicotinamide N-methyase